MDNNIFVIYDVLKVNRHVPMRQQQLIRSLDANANKKRREEKRTMDCCVFGFDMTAVIAASLCLCHSLIKCIQNVCVSTIE